MTQIELFKRELLIRRYSQSTIDTYCSCLKVIISKIGQNTISITTNSNLMSEKLEHRQICRYLRIQYPDVIFNTDLSGIKLNQGQAIAVKSLRSSNGFPDIMIFEARKGFNGLFIELKKSDESIYKKDGTPKTDHIRQQELMISNLKKRGYEACFCIGFEQAKAKIDWYLK